MNRRERTLSPIPSGPRRLLLPRISHYFNRTANAATVDIGGNGGGDVADAAVNWVSWEYNDRITQEQSRRQVMTTLQLQQRRQQQQSAKEAERQTSCSQSCALFPALADLIEKVELLPDDDDDDDDADAIAREEQGSQGGRDSIFSLADDDIDDADDGGRRRPGADGKVQESQNLDISSRRKVSPTYCCLSPF
jgi:hypothetical protein